MIPWNLDGVVQPLARHSNHAEHVILRGIRRDGESMKVQVRHVPARIHGTSLAGFGRKIVDVVDFERVPRGGSDHGSIRAAVENESVPPIFILGAKRKGNDVILGAHLRWFRQHDRLSVASRSKKYLRGDKK